MIRWLRHFIKKIFYYVWSLFLSGFLTILPLALTIVLFHVSAKLITSWLEPVREFLPPQLLELVPHVEIVVIIAGIVFVGTILRIFVLHTIIHSLEEMIITIPLIRPVYSGIKQLVQAFSIQDKITFKQVVFIEFPRKGLYSLGFLTSELAQDIAPHNEQHFYNVFIPTTPNPTSGYFIIVQKSDIQIVDLTRHEAMAMIISGGIIQPDRFIKQPHATQTAAEKI